MLSEYQIECPECGYLKARHYRKLNHLSTHLECPKCGLEKEGCLPREDEKISRLLKQEAESRISRFSAGFDLSSNGIRTLIAPLVYMVVVYSYTRDFKLILILFGFFLIILAHPTILRIHKQMTYVARLLQYRYMMDDELDEILGNRLMGPDLIHDYEMSAGVFDADGLKKLDSRYLAYAEWLASELRSIGCDDETIENERNKLKEFIHRSVPTPTGSES